ncbi:hypothetical protein BCR39DRAFT_525879 [Naematelia encephala]|uniref:Uncharacterized protein n=1 Tax=Naematelia encephala TaxID=71784 RepID=A0A1Y2BBZ0_9TREE|nr:hypothetical protein BCR39DRAFT_525879 [Naematelia encephala]
MSSHQYTKSVETDNSFSSYQPTAVNHTPRLESANYTGPVFLNPPPDYSSIDTPEFRLQSAVDTAISKIPDATAQRVYTLTKSDEYMGFRFPIGYARYSTTHKTSCFYAHIGADEHALMWTFTVSAYLRDREVNNFAGETLTVFLEPGEVTFGQRLKDQIPLGLGWSISRLGQCISNGWIATWKERGRPFTTRPSIVSHNIRYPDESDVMVSLDLTLGFWRPYDEPEPSLDPFTQAEASQGLVSQPEESQAGPSRESLSRRGGYGGLVRTKSRMCRDG